LELKRGHWHGLPHICSQPMRHQCFRFGADTSFKIELSLSCQGARPQRCRPRSSTYFVCGFSGDALPVIGAGVISTLASPTAASLAFAATISLALVAPFFGIKYPQ
jgi:hypothetical protein